MGSDVRALSHLGWVLTLAALAGGLGWLLAGRPTGPAAEVAGDSLGALAAWLAGTVAPWARDHPGPAALVAAGVVGPPVWSASTPWLPKRPDAARDPVRWFDSDQRRSGFARAQGRCEMEILPGIRCRRSAEHGDHWLPHARGGATSMGNFVAACSTHNLAKSARIPTRGQTARIAWRRRRYFPAGLDRRPGELARRR